MILNLLSSTIYYHFQEWIEAVGGFLIVALFLAIVLVVMVLPLLIVMFIFNLKLYRFVILETKKEVWRISRSQVVAYESVKHSYPDNMVVSLETYIENKKYSNNNEE